MFLLASAAHAADEFADEEEKPERLSREILLSVDELAPRGPSLDEHFHFSTKRGVEFRREIPLAGQKARLLLYGPLIKKKPGLRLRIEGVTLGGHNVSVKGYAGIKKQGVAIRIDF